MMVGKGAATIAKAIDPKGASVKGAVAGPRLRPRFAPLPLSVSVEFWQLGPEESLSDRVTRLAPSTENCLKVRISRRGAIVYENCDLVADTDLLSEFLWLGFECSSSEIRIQSCEDPLTESDPAQFVRIDRKTLEQGFETNFHVWVPPDCVSTPATFTLFVGREPNSVKLTELTVPMLGGRSPLSVQEYAAIGLTPDTRVPENMAFLHVSERGDGKLHLEWYFRSLKKTPKIEELGSFALVRRVKVRDARRRAAEIEGFVRELQTFSRRQGELNACLAALLQPETVEPIVIINDQSRAEIPWELFQIGDSALGASSEVVRWARVNGGDHRLALTETRLKGTVAKYLGVAAAEAGLEDAELVKLEAQSMASFDHLVTSLNQEQGPEAIALVYIACHAEFPDRRPYIWRPKGQDGAESFTELDLERLHVRNPRRLLVIANSCQSGRVRDAGLAASGPVERCLAKVALGYVGTLCDVLTTNASEIGAQMLAKVVAGGEGVRMSKALRDIRRDALAQLSEHRSTEQQWLRLIHAFCYVYFGEPLALMEVRSSQVLVAHTVEVQGE